MYRYQSSTGSHLHFASSSTLSMPRMTTFTGIPRLEHDLIFPWWIFALTWHQQGTCPSTSQQDQRFIVQPQKDLTPLPAGTRLQSYAQSLMESQPSSWCFSLRPSAMHLQDNTYSDYFHTVQITWFHRRSSYCWATTAFTSVSYTLPTDGCFTGAQMSQWLSSKKICLRNSSFLQDFGHS